MSHFQQSSLPTAVLVLPLFAFLSQCSHKPVSQELPPAPPVTAQAPAKPARAEFKPGDQLELFVKEDQTLNGSYLVREGGYIVIPRAGRISVSGMTREEAEPRVREVLLKTQLKEASVIVERTAVASAASPGMAAGEGVSKKLVYLTGSVSRPGGHAIPVPAGKTVGVYEALLISGGLGKFAKPEQIEIFRFDANGKRKKTLVNLRAIMEGTAEDPAIVEGDIINVPEKVFGF